MKFSTLFEAVLEQPLLWVACKHNIPGLLIKHASITIRGETKGSDLNVSLVLLTLINEQSRNGRIPSMIGDIVGLRKYYSGLIFIYRKQPDQGKIIESC